MNVIARLEYELAYYDSAVHRFNHYTTRTPPNEFLFADNCPLNATKANMQNSVDKFSMACDNFGLIITTKKTEVNHRPVPRKPYVEPNITIKGQRLKVVEKFIYLGSTLSKSIIMDDEVNTRLAKVSAALLDSSGICGIGEASWRQPKSRNTELSFLPPSFMAVKRGQLINGIWRN